MNPKAVASVARVSLNMPSSALLDFSCPFATHPFARGPFCFQHRVRQGILLGCGQWWKENGMNPKAVASVARVSLNMPSMALLDFSCPFATDPFARGPFCFQHRVRQGMLLGFGQWWKENGMNPKAVASVARVSLNMPSSALLDFSCPLATDPFARGPFCFQHRVRQGMLLGCGQWWKENGMNPKAVASVARVSLNMPSMALLDFSCPFATDPFARGPFCFQHRVRQGMLLGCGQWWKENGMNPKAVASVARVSLNMPSSALLDFSCPLATDLFARGPFCFQHRVRQGMLLGCG